MIFSRRGRLKALIGSGLVFAGSLFGYFEDFAFSLESIRQLIWFVLILTGICFFLVFLIPGKYVILIALFVFTFYWGFQFDFYIEGTIFQSGWFYLLIFLSTLIFTIHFSKILRQKRSWFQAHTRQDPFPSQDSSQETIDHQI